ncbi:MAG TPA: hypothetical protein VMU48_18780 [Terracidiphilus sp.]|nr:hypothetical protein [Terracidiphilus sp.]
MRPQTIGRVLGIGLRVAGRVASQRINGDAQVNTTQQVSAAANPNPGNADGGARGRGAGQNNGSLRRGIAGFLRPFGRVGRNLWLEVTGVFFLIFVPVFIWRGMWPARASYLHGPEHLRFLAYAGLALAFLYLGVSSFWRASRK